jgi:hypothetical protein
VKVKRDLPFREKQERDFGSFLVEDIGKAPFGIQRQRWSLIPCVGRFSSTPGPPSKNTPISIGQSLVSAETDKHYKKSLEGPFLPVFIGAGGRN